MGFAAVVLVHVVVARSSQNLRCLDEPSGIDQAQCQENVSLSRLFLAITFLEPLRNVQQPGQLSCRGTRVQVEAVYFDWGNHVTQHFGDVFLLVVFGFLFIQAYQILAVNTEVLFQIQVKLNWLRKGWCMDINRCVACFRLDTVHGDVVASIGDATGLCICELEEGFPEGWVVEANFETLTPITQQLLWSRRRFRNCVPGSVPTVWSLASIMQSLWWCVKSATRTSFTCTGISISRCSPATCCCFANCLSRAFRIAI